MPTSLAQVRTAPLDLEPSPSHYLSGADLARFIRATMTTVPACKRLDDSEADALAQTVALTVLRRKLAAPEGRTRAQVCEHGTTRTPADVLRWVDRCERFPTLAARSEAAILRGSIGRTYLRTVIESTLAQSSSWQDTADRYRTRAQARKGEGARVQPLGLASGETDALAREIDAQDRRRNAQGADVEVTPQVLADLARGVAQVIGEERGWTRAQARNATAALHQHLATVGGLDVVRVLRDLAQGRTLNAVRIDATRGSALLAQVPADLLTATVEAVARRMGAYTAATWDALDLDRPARAAGEAVATLARMGGAWDDESIGTARSLPAWEDRTVPAQSAPGSRGAVLAYVEANLPK